MFKTAQTIVLAVLAVLVLLFVSRPLLLDIQVIQQQVANYQTAVDQAGTFNRLLSDTLARQESVSALERERLDVLLPTKVNPVETLVNIEALAGVHGMVFQSAATQADPAKDESVIVSRIGVTDVSTREITVDLLGTYSQFRAFMEDLERSLPLIEVETLSFLVTEGDLTLFSFSLHLPQWSPGTIASEAFE